MAIRLLQKVFTPDNARVALTLGMRPTPAADIVKWHVARAENRAGPLARIAVNSWFAYGNRRDARRHRSH